MSNHAAAHDDLERARSALYHLDPGCERESWVKIAGAAKDAGIDFEDFHAWSSNAGNYTGEADVRSMWRSIKPNRGATIASLFHMAKQQGWKQGGEPAPRPVVRSAPEPEQQTPKHDPAQLWEACEPATAEHGYIKRKGGRPDGLKVYRGPLSIARQSVDGWLVLPVRDTQAQIVSLQFVAPEKTGSRDKLNLPGCPVAGFHVVGGKLERGKKAYVVEGIGQAWTVSAATGCPALVTFGVGNTAKVARFVHAGGAKPVIVADRGKEAEAARLATEIGCTWVEMPSDMRDGEDINDLQAAEGAEAVLAVLDQEKTHAANDNSPAFSFTRVGDMLHHLKPIDWLVKGYIEADSLALMFGDPGCGKSFLAIDLACSVATGKDWHGKSAKRGPVFYIAGEGQNGLARRFKAWELHNDETLADAPLYVSQRAAALYDEDAALMVSAAVNDLAKHAGQAPRLIVIDTLARNFGGANENATEDMNRFVSNLDAHLKARFKACVLIVHHTGHADKTRARGAMALKGALDAEYCVTKDQDSGLVRIEATKMKDAEAPEPLAFTLDRVALPFMDEDGNPVASVAPRCTAYVEPPRAGKAGRGKNQTKALQTLRDMEEENAARLESTGFTGSGARVREDDWRDALDRYHGIDRRRFSEVRKGLTEAGLVIAEPGGYVRTA